MITHKEVFAVLRNPWTATFNTLLSEVEADLLLVSPFIKLSKTQEVLSALRRRRIERMVKVGVLTNIHPASVLSGALDLEAFAEFSKRLPKFDLIHLPGLHAKVYVADVSMVIITSANLTEPGLSRNIEYGVVSTNSSLVSQVRRDFERYATLGARIPASEVAGLVADADELKSLYQKAQRTIRRNAERAFREKLEATSVRVLRNRARGRTTQSILSETILFLLEGGALRTEELHPLIRHLQPDLCNDGEDRVIDGVHFGKKWKHHVRSAQQALKRAGRVYFDGERWQKVASGLGSVAEPPEN